MKEKKFVTCEVVNPEGVYVRLTAVLPMSEWRIILDALEGHMSLSPGNARLRGAVNHVLGEMHEKVTKQFGEPNDSSS